MFVCAAGALLAAQSVAPPDLPPARPGLLRVPLPDLESLEAAVVRQMRDVQGSAAGLMASGTVGDAELADAYGVLGQLHHAYEFLDAAEASYRNASRLAPRDHRWPHLLGHLYQQSGRLEEAAVEYASALATRPDDDVVQVYLGEVYLRLGRRADASAQFEKVLPMFPAVAHNGLGELALLDGRHADAVRHLSEALQRAPHATRIHYSLGMAYRGLGRLGEARDHVRQAGAGSVRAADALVDALQDLLQGERALLIQGRFAYQAGAYDAAADAFRRAVAAAPDRAGAHVNLGAALAQLGELDDAVEALETALRLDTDDLTAHLSLGSVLAHQGRHAEAIEHFRAVTRGAPAHAEGRRQLARSLMRLGRHDEAIDLLVAVTPLDPADEESLLSFALDLVDREEFRRALDLLERVNGLFPDRTLTATTLARMLAAVPEAALREGARALEIATRVHEREPSPAHGETVALSLAELGRCAEAADWMRRSIATAQRAGDAAEAARLARELPRYERAPCN